MFRHCIQVAPSHLVSTAVQSLLFKLSQQATALPRRVVTKCLLVQDDRGVGFEEDRGLDWSDGGRDAPGSSPGHDRLQVLTVKTSGLVAAARAGAT